MLSGFAAKRISSSLRLYEIDSIFQAFGLRGAGKKADKVSQLTSLIFTKPSRVPVGNGRIRPVSDVNLVDFGIFFKLTEQENQSQSLKLGSFSRMSLNELYSPALSSMVKLPSLSLLSL
jgi:hypothetical protein